MILETLSDEKISHWSSLSERSGIFEMDIPVLDDKDFILDEKDSDVELVSDATDMVVSESFTSQPTCSKFDPDHRTDRTPFCVEVLDSDSCSSQDNLKYTNKPATLNGQFLFIKTEKKTKESCLAYFGLVPKATAASIQQEHKEVIDIDCEIIAVEGLDDCDNVPMTSPRTPRSLMSQLSRDNDGSSRKRLFSVSGPVNDTEDQCDESFPKTSIQGSLLTIDFSSFLGQRVRKHVKSDVCNHIIKNIEAHCTTTWVKNNFVEKLRHRQSDYPVTFRKKKKGNNRHRQCHDYKFTAGERREFMRVSKTGLNKEARQLKRKMKNVVIKLIRVSPAVIQSWKKQKTLLEPIWIDDDISIVQIDPPPGTSSSLSGHNYSNSYHQQQSYHANHMNSNARCSQEPRPQFLVKKVEKQLNSQMSSELVFLPLAGETKARLYPNNISCSKPGSRMLGPACRRKHMGPASRRKQNFSHLRTDLSFNDDNISVKSLSSDEDDNLHHHKQNGSVASNAGFPFNYGMASKASSSNQHLVSILNRPSPTKQKTYTETIPAVDFNDLQQSTSGLTRGNNPSQQYPCPKSNSGSSVIHSKKNLCLNFPNLQKSLNWPSKTETQLAMLNATNRQRLNVKKHNSSVRPVQLCNVLNDSNKGCNTSPLTIASVYSLSAGNEDTPVTHVEIGQMGSLTGGTNNRTLTVPSFPVKPSNSLRKISEYVVERNIDSDTNEIVEVICIEDDDF